MGRRNVTATAVAEATGMTTSTLSMRLNAVSSFNVDELRKIAEFLHVEPRIFFPRVEQAENKPEPTDSEAAA